MLATCPTFVETPRKLTDRQNELLTVVKNAQQSVIAGIRSGLKAGDADGIAREAIRAAVEPGIYIEGASPTLADLVFHLRDQASFQLL